MKSIKSPASNQEWQAWGKLDPLYGVATLPERAKNETNPWTDESFYPLGAADWKRFHPKWRQYGLKSGACIEIGCGAGRMTVHMASDFDVVHAVDISAEMIEYARLRAPANVVFHVGSGTGIPLPADSADGVFSTHVLQHLSSPAAASAYFGEMYRVLKPGGSIMIHLPVIAWPGGSLMRIHHFIHRAKCLLDGGRVALRRYMFRRALIRTPPMQVIWYEVSWVYHTLERLGFGDVEIRTLFGGSKMAVQHPFVFARKAGATSDAP